MAAASLPTGLRREDVTVFEAGTRRRWTCFLASWLGEPTVFGRMPTPCPDGMSIIEQPVTDQASRVAGVELLRDP
ncbi:hypothetical protein [Streptomyces sp. NBC_00878]|uniref:hypothetical protein n=1 Tax=Streptomyces sp. NBC_00878 TaxID=2975854 RepID=UPI002252D368|nr:hypothetical protein [Streptomyces sp. NBC_00878]MCX4903546.1 hypothetical protein [Streptomyces sp. NBC_00878]